MFVSEFVLGKGSVKKTENEVAVCRGFMKLYEKKPSKMFIEDLAALEKLNEESILEEVRNRTKTGSCYTFIGDILLAVNANETTMESPSVRSFVHIIFIYNNIRF